MARCWGWMGRQSSLLDEFFLFSRRSFKNGRLACKSARARPGLRDLFRLLFSTLVHTKPSVSLSSFPSVSHLHAPAIVRPVLPGNLDSSTIPLASRVKFVARHPRHSNERSASPILTSTRVEIQLDTYGQAKRRATIINCISRASAWIDIICATNFSLEFLISRALVTLLTSPLDQIISRFFPRFVAL